MVLQGDKDLYEPMQYLSQKGKWDKSVPIVLGNIHYVA